MGALAIGVATIMMASCDKVSPTGVLLGNTGVDDRVEMSVTYYRNIDPGLGGIKGWVVLGGEDYTFLVGSDSHIQNDSNRMAEMCKIALDNGDALMAHLGDIADTKAEYYMRLKQTLFHAAIEKMESEGNKFYRNEDGNVLINDQWQAFYTPAYEGAEEKILDMDLIDFKETLSFFPVVGNHDITHNGWALFSNIFGSTFYDVYVLRTPLSASEWYFDHLIFLDSANGTLGEKQVEYIDQLTENPSLLGVDKDHIRNTFVFTHTNIFRPQSFEFASTFAREERYYLLNKFKEWNAHTVFLGHVHEWDERDFGDVHYVTMASMSSENNPAPGEYLMRVHVHADGTVTYERVKMNYTPTKK